MISSHRLPQLPSLPDVSSADKGTRTRAVTSPTIQSAVNKLGADRLSLEASSTQPPSLKSKEVVKKSALQGSTLNIGRRVSTSAVKVLQIKEFAKVAATKAGLSLQTIDKSSSTVIVKKATMTSAEKVASDAELNEYKEKLDAFPTTTKSGSKVKDVLGEDGLAKLNEGTINGDPKAEDRTDELIPMSKRQFVAYNKDLKENPNQDVNKAYLTKWLDAHKSLGSPVVKIVKAS